MKETLKYKFLTLFRYLGDSLYYPFISLYLKSCGLIEDNIGLLLSLSPLIGILTNPIYTKICKNIKVTKLVLTIISTIEALIIFIISFNSSFVPLTILVLLLAVFGSCHYGMMDSLLTMYSTNSDTSYSSIRIFGSIAYVIGTTVGGYVIKYMNYHWCFGFASILFILSSFFYLIILPMNEEAKVEEEKPKYKELFKQKDYYLFALVFFLLLASAYSSDHFFPLYLETKGINSDGYGIIYSYVVLVECITLFVLSKLKNRFNADILLLICAISLFFRQFVNFLDLPGIPTAILACFRGIFYGIFLHIMYVYAEKLLGKKLAIMGIMTMTLCHQILLFALENINGNIIKNFGYRPFYILMMGFALVAVILQIIRMIMIKVKGKEKIVI